MFFKGWARCDEDLRRALNGSWRERIKDRMLV